ncbi:MAG TPA: molybdopterin-dependent oxidoreductase [Candidatus Angelobacter sp.]|jgi:hypothetical protein|nr:molybdopterin-dependent oxidoreductase [Candidatus Angelobacter sp.]
MKRLTLFVLLTVFQLAAQAQQAPLLQVSGDVSHARTFEQQDWKQLKHISISATNAHDKKTASYSGVPLRDLLKDAGVPSGENLRGKAMSTCIVVSATDGYQVAFSWAELDESVGNLQVLIADSEDGRPLVEGNGPLRLVVPTDKRPARWVRMVKTIRVVANP